MELIDITTNRIIKDGEINKTNLKVTAGFIDNIIPIIFIKYKV